PKIVSNVDGSPNTAGSILRSLSCLVSTGSHSRSFDFFVTNLGSESLILGYPWLAYATPTISWSSASV
ncbi:hypothetical protein B0F90DRAFT_1553008, partial [Multifurca ochricompacta]